MRKFLKIIYVTWAVIWFLAFMLLIFPLVVIASLWGRINGGNFIYQLLYAWSAFWFFMTGIRPKVIHEEATERGKQYVFVANHMSNLDAAMIVNVLRHPFRPLGKIELQGIPVFGFIYRICVVVVDRSDAEHRRKSLNNLKSIMTKGVSILIFPEGTFNETGEPLKEMYDGAFRLAIETQTPIKPIIFPDNYARLDHHSLLSLNPGLCRTVFLEAIPVEGLTLADVGKLKEQVSAVMASKLREYNASWIRDNTR
jgi:1-acyl-sn-glycerol-3-phosphate acyltransferase